MEECLKCGKMVDIQQVEILPDGGILEVAVHDKKTICKWTTYNNIDDMQKLYDKKLRVKDNPEIVCPRCNEKGILRWHHNAGENKVEEHELRMDYRYYVEHKDKKRCDMSLRGGLRVEALKRCGRFISMSKYGVYERT